MLIGLAIKALILAAIPLALVYVARGHDRYRRLAWVTVFFTFDLIVFGAFTRLTDSGLGCPDWPGQLALKAFRVQWVQLDRRARQVLQDRRDTPLPFRANGQMFATILQAIWSSPRRTPVAIHTYVSTLHCRDLRDGFRPLLQTQCRHFLTGSHSIRNVV